MRITITDVTAEFINAFLSGVESFLAKNCGGSHYQHYFEVKDRCWNYFISKLSRDGVTTQNLKAYGYSTAFCENADLLKSARCRNETSAFVTSKDGEEFSLFDKVAAKTVEDYDDEWEFLLSSEDRAIVRWMLEDMPQVSIGVRTRGKVEKLVTEHFHLSHSKFQSIFERIQRCYLINHGIPEC